jgi:protein TonB
MRMFSGLSVAQPATRRWMALASFTLQAAIVTGVLVFPMLYPQSLPQVFLTRRIFVPMSKGEVRADTKESGKTSAGPARPHVLVVSNHGLIFGKAQPSGTDNSPDLPLTGIEIGAGPDLGPQIGMGTPIMPHRPAQSFRTSVVMEGNLISRVEPQYPVIARQIRLEGSVVLKAIISRDGKIEQVEVVSGSALLARPAVDAVREWRYRPCLLNGEPVEVETQITVNFVLGH